MSWPDPITPDRPANIADEFQAFLTDHGQKLAARQQQTWEQQQAVKGQRAADNADAMSRLLDTLDDQHHD